MGRAESMRRHWKAPLRLSTSFCVCVCERERERERARKSERERDGEKVMECATGRRRCA